MGNSYRYLIVLAIILLLIGLSSLKVAKTGLTIASGEEEPEDMGELTQLGCGDGNCRMDAGETCVSCGADCGDCPPEQPPATCTDYDANEPINGVYTSNYAALSGGTGKDSAFYDACLECATTNSFPPTTRCAKVREAKCVNNQLTTEDISCNAGCENGRCKCYDDDSQQQDPFLVVGHTYGKHWQYLDDPSKALYGTDYCIVNQGDVNYGRLREYSCNTNGVVIGNDYVDCAARYGTGWECVYSGIGVREGMEGKCAKPTCGDRICTLDEGASCTFDCGTPCAPNGICEWQENIGNCPEDCSQRLVRDVAEMSDLVEYGEDWTAENVELMLNGPQERFLLDVFLNMYKVTGDEQWLDRFVLHADTLLMKRDDTRGVVDWTGQSRATWSNRLLSFASISQPDPPNLGEVGIRADSVLTPEQARNDFHADYERILNAYFTYYNPDWNHIWDRLTVRGGGMYMDVPLRTTFQYLEGTSSDEIISSSNNVGLIFERIPGLPPPRLYSETTQFGITYTRFGEALNDGRIIYPMTKFAQTVLNNPELDEYRDDAIRYIEEAERVVATHNVEWREAGDYGYYIFPYGSPFKFDGVNVPHNQQLSLGRAIVVLYDLTGKEEYGNKATRLAKTFKNNLVLESEGSYTWNYNWGLAHNGWNEQTNPGVFTDPVYAGYKRIELTGEYAGMELDFVSEAYDHGIVFTQEDMQRFVNTFNKRINTPSMPISKYVNGAGGEGSTSNLAHFVELCRFDHSIWPRAYQHDYSSHLTYASPYTLQLSSIMLLYQQQCSGIDPCPTAESCVDL